MSLLDDFERVSKRVPCPVCERPDWCLVRFDGGQPVAAICQRVTSGVAWGEAGHLHRLDDTWTPPPRVAASSPKMGPTPSYLGSLSRVLASEVEPDLLQGLVLQLGVSAESLRRLGLGCATGDGVAELGVRGRGPVWTFPMHGAEGNVVGIRLRLTSGKKLSVKGSRNGLFLARSRGSSDTLFVAEGESDTAALLTLGVEAMGRPGAGNGADLVLAHVLRTRPTRVMVVADRDAAGQAGATSLAQRLRRVSGLLVDVIEPPEPHGDVRAWLNAGATPDDLADIVLDARTCCTARSAS